MGALSELRSIMGAVLGLERREVTPTSLLGLVGAQSIGSGYDVVTARTVENVATVLGCVAAITTAVSTLPCYVYERRGDTRREILDHPLSRIIRYGANPLQTWGDLLESLLSDALLQGNGLLEILRDGGRVTGFRFIPWGWVRVSLLPSGRLAYDVTEGGALMGAPGRQFRLLQSEVIHLRDRSDDGYIGRSRLSRSADTFNAAMTTNKAAAAFLANGSRLGGILETEQEISGEAVQRLREQWYEDYTGPQNQGRTLILEGGLAFKPLSVSPEDSELLASRKFSVEEICRVFQVPPPMVQDLSHGTFTNSREAARWFCQFTLTPWVRKLEAEFARAIFAEDSGLELELDMSGLLRADPESRWASHKIAVDAGILDADEIREIEGFNKRAPIAMPVPGAAQ